MNAPVKIEPTGLDLLRVPFASNHISKLPKPTKKQTDEVKADFKKGRRCTVCGSWHHPDVVHLDYVGHAALTDRLLDADPHWDWEPFAVDGRGLPAFDQNGGLWIRLTVCGQTRIGYGDADGKVGGSAVKETIGDALRNAAMRFGAALDLWHKGDLHADEAPEGQSQNGAVSPQEPSDLQSQLEQSVENERAARGRNNGPTKSLLDQAEKRIVRELQSCDDEETLVGYLGTEEYKADKALLEEHRPSALYGPAPAGCPEYVPIKTMITRMVAEFRGPVREASPVDAG